MKTAVFLVTMALTTGMASAADAPKAPQPAKPVDAASFYAGRWYEIGRTPLSLTDGCVAGYTDYQMKDGGLYERDACRDKTPDGEEKVIGGPLTILNPGQNSKIHVTYHIVLGLIPINRDYWMLDHADGWFMETTPDMTFVDLYTRDPHPAPALVDKMTREIRDLGYTGKLEFPAQATAEKPAAPPM
jgi:apolipoprotein D and lipocalin family protein